MSGRGYPDPPRPSREELAAWARENARALGRASDAALYAEDPPAESLGSRPFLGGDRGICYISERTKPLRAPAGSTGGHAYGVISSPTSAGSDFGRLHAIGASPTSAGSGFGPPHALMSAPGPAGSALGHTHAAMSAASPAGFASRARALTFSDDLSARFPIMPPGTSPSSAGSAPVHMRTVVPTAPPVLPVSGAHDAGFERDWKSMYPVGTSGTSPTPFHAPPVISMELASTLRENEMLKAENLHLNQQREATLTHLRNAIDENDKLKVKDEENKKKSEELQAFLKRKYEELQAYLEKIYAQYTQAHDENMNFQMEITRLRDVEGELKNAAAQNEDDLQRYAIQLRDVIQQNNDYQEKLGQYSMESSMVELNVKQLQRENEELRHALHESNHANGQMKDILSESDQKLGFALANCEECWKYANYFGSIAVGKEHFPVPDVLQRWRLFQCLMKPGDIPDPRSTGGYATPRSSPRLRDTAIETSVSPLDTPEKKSAPVREPTSTATDIDEEPAGASGWGAWVPGSISALFSGSTPSAAEAARSALESLETSADTGGSKLDPGLRASIASALKTIPPSSAPDVPSGTPDRMEDARAFLTCASRSPSEVPRPAIPASAPPPVAAPTSSASHVPAPPPPMPADFRPKPKTTATAELVREERPVTRSMGTKTALTPGLMDELTAKFAAGGLKPASERKERPGLPRKDPAGVEVTLYDKITKVGVSTGTLPAPASDPDSDWEDDEKAIIWAPAPGLIIDVPAAYKSLPEEFWGPSGIVDGSVLKDSDKVALNGGVDIITPFDPIGFANITSVGADDQLDPALLPRKLPMSLAAQCIPGRTSAFLTRAIYMQYYRLYSDGKQAGKDRETHKIKVNPCHKYDWMAKHMPDHPLIKIISDHLKSVAKPA